MLLLLWGSWGGGGYWPWQVMTRHLKSENSSEVKVKGWFLASKLWKCSHIVWIVCQEECPRLWPNSHRGSWLHAGGGKGEGARDGRGEVLCGRAAPRGCGSWKQTNSSQISPWEKKTQKVVRWHSQSEKEEQMKPSELMGSWHLRCSVPGFRCEQFPSWPLTSARLFTAVSPISGGSHIPGILSLTMLATWLMAFRTIRSNL